MATATVSVFVSPTVVADSPTLTVPVNTPVAAPILSNAEVNGVTGVTVADLDGPPVTIDIDPPGSVTVWYEPVSGMAFIVPAEDFCGTATVTYQIEKTCEVETSGALGFSNFGYQMVGACGGLDNVSLLEGVINDFEFGVTAFTTYMISDPANTQGHYTWVASPPHYELTGGIPVDAVEGGVIAFVADGMSGVYFFDIVQCPSEG